MVASIDEYYIGIVEKLVSMPAETEWLEYKLNNWKPETIGEYISALSNSAAIYGKEKAYMLWGIDDKTHRIIGTKISWQNQKIGNSDLETWLNQMLSPKIDFKFIDVNTSCGKVVLLEIQKAVSRPTCFQNRDYIRHGSTKRFLSDFPEKERKLWLSFENKPYELSITKENLNSSEITELLDCASFYTLMKLPLPSTRKAIMHDMTDYEFIKVMDNGNYKITNMGALLFAKNLNKFDNLKRKAVRVIRYKGKSRINAISEEIFYSGYAIAFSNICNYIKTLLQQREEINGSLRENYIMFPINGIREMIGNTIIHQDLTAHGSGPIIEVFDTRIEASNPGSLLVDVNRIIDTAPHSRNENIASFLRIINICEERGSGFDRMEAGMSELKIPAPKVETAEDFCRTKLYWYSSLKEWPKEEIIRTCYLHTCYCYVNEITVNNSVMRKRFDISEENKSIVSRIMKNTIDAGLIKLVDENAGPKARRYIPYWA